MDARYLDQPLPRNINQIVINSVAWSFKRSLIHNKTPEDTNVIKRLMDLLICIEQTYYNSLTNIFNLIVNKTQQLSLLNCTLIQARLILYNIQNNDCIVYV